MSYYEPEEVYGGFDPNDPAMLQAMLDQYLMGTGETFGPGGPYGDINVPAMDPGQYQALAGLLPNTQPSGKPMTPSNYTGMLSSNRSALFDPALMGFGGMDAFAPNAFESTVTSSIKQTPELQQMYGYLRTPDSYEGLIADEILNGGNAGTALRKIRELLADPNTDQALKDSLLLELPQRPVEYGMPAPDLTAENVNWDADENSVAGRAREINELYAQIPRVGPSGPQWDPATGQMISAGGQLQWGEDETGAPVMIEVTETPSPLAEKYHALGLPTPDQEYTAESFMTPDQIAMQQALGEIEDPIAQLKAAWMDPNLAPSNWESQGPAGVPAAPGWGGPGAQGPSDVAINPGVTPEEMAMVDRVRQNALAPQGSGPPPPSILDPQVIAPLAEQLIAEGHDLPPDWTYVINPDGSIGEPLPPEYQAGGVSGKLPAGAAGNRPRIRPLTGEEEPPGEQIGPPAPGRTQPGPFPDNYPSEVSGYNFIRSPQEDVLAQILGQQAPPPYAQPGAMPARQPGEGATTPLPPYAQPGAQPARQPGEGATQPASQPVFGDNNLANALQAIIQAGQPASLPPYAQPGAMPARQPGEGATTPVFGNNNLAGAFQALIQAGQPTATPQVTNAMLAQIIGGGQQEPGYQQGAGEPARQPGGPGLQQEPGYQQGAGSQARQPGGASYLQAVETGEGRAARRQADEQQAQILGGSTDRTGKRVRPTRTGEQARQYRAAFDAWDQATDEQRRMKQAAHNAASGRALGEAWKLQQQGVRPLDQALMARRLVLMGAGMPQGRAPGL